VCDDGVIALIGNGLGEEGEEEGRKIEPVHANRCGKAGWWGLFGVSSVHIINHYIYYYYYLLNVTKR